MAIAPTCDRCGNELLEYGAILLGPPNSEDMARKMHLCVGCYERIVADFAKEKTEG
jgi:hypothetical protein